MNECNLVKKEIIILLDFSALDIQHKMLVLSNGRKSYFSSCKILIMNGKLYKPQKEIWRIVKSEHVVIIFHIVFIQ